MLATVAGFLLIGFVLLVWVFLELSFYDLLGGLIARAFASWPTVLAVLVLMVGGGTWLFLEGERLFGFVVWGVGVFIGLMRLLAEHANDDGALY